MCSKVDAVTAVGDTTASYVGKLIYTLNSTLDVIPRIDISNTPIPEVNGTEGDLGGAGTRRVLQGSFCGQLGKSDVVLCVCHVSIG